MQIPCSKLKRVTIFYIDLKSLLCGVAAVPYNFPFINLCKTTYIDSLV